MGFPILVRQSLHIESGPRSNSVNTMAADNLAPCVTRSSASMVLTMQYQVIRALCFKWKDFNIIEVPPKGSANCHKIVGHQQNRSIPASVLAPGASNTNFTESLCIYIVQTLHVLLKITRAGMTTWALFQYPITRLIVRSHFVLKPQDLYI